MVVVNFSVSLLCRLLVGCEKMRDNDPAADPTFGRACQLAAAPSKNFYDLALALVEVSTAAPSLHLLVGKQIGITRRRIYYLLQVGRFLTTWGIAKEQAEALGWTKLLVVARFVAGQESLSTSDVSKLLGLAAASTAHQLPGVLATATLATVTPHAMLLRLSTEQYQVITAALLANGATRKRNGIGRKEEALTSIALASLQTS